MPNIREQRVTKDDLYLMFSNGGTITITRAEIVAHYQGEAGSAAARKAATIAWLKDQIATAAGAQIDTATVTFDFDTVDSAKVMTLEVTG